ncbi:MAG TPA: M23 family metallopeptidase [Saprospiraceae bacterium]|nr:M23 family metallopeptidase [Saprospiraceae bacterium]
MKFRIFTLLVLMGTFVSFSFGQLIYTNTINNENEIKIEFLDDLRPPGVFISHVKYAVTFFATNRTRMLPFVVDITASGTGIERSNMKGSETVLPGESRKKIFAVVKVGKEYKIDYEYTYRIGNFYHSKHDDNVVYEIPFKSDTIVVDNQQFKKKKRKKRANRATTVDFSLPIGTEIFAARAGKVVKVVMNNSKFCPERTCVDFDNYILIMHEDGTIAKYGHLSPKSNNVVFGQEVKKGALLALSGETGRTTKPSLHFEVYEVKRYKNQPLAVKFALFGKEEVLKVGRYFQK